MALGKVEGGRRTPGHSRSPMVQFAGQGEVALAQWCRQDSQGGPLLGRHPSVTVTLVPWTVRALLRRGSRHRRWDPMTSRPYSSATVRGAKRHFIFLIHGLVQGQLLLDHAFGKYQPVDAAQRVGRLRARIPDPVRADVIVRQEPVDISGEDAPRACAIVTPARLSGR